MAESTIVKTLQDGTLTLAALGGGAFNTSTGALISPAKSYTVAFEEGNVSFTPPSRTMSNFKDRGRTTNPPSIRHGEDTEGTLSFTVYFRDATDATAATLNDIAATMAGNASGYVGSNWESTRASSAGAGDADEFTVAAKFVVTNQGDSSDTHEFGCNYLFGTLSYSDGDPSTLSFDGVVYDAVDQWILI